MRLRALHLLALWPLTRGIRKGASRQEVVESQESREALHGDQIECPDVSGSGTVKWSAFGGVNQANATLTVQSKAAAGDYEFVAIGGSRGGSSSNNNVPWDADLMTSQGFALIVVRGPDDRKASLWWRKSTGGGTVKITGKAKDNPYTILTAKGDLKVECVKTATVSKSHSSKAKLEFPGGTGFTLGVFFFDDSGKLAVPPSPGKLACRNWGYGDGDGFGVVVYQPGDQPRSEYPYEKLDGGGSQYITVTAVIPVGVECTPNPPSPPGGSPSPPDDSRRRRRRRRRRG